MGVTILLLDTVGAMFVMKKYHVWDFMFCEIGHLFKKLYLSYILGTVS